MNLSRDFRDIGSGLVLCLVGVALLIHALTSYRMGTPANIGPGVWPATLGALLALMGLAIAAIGFFRSGQRVEVEWRSLIAILLALLAFGLLLRPAGLIPAIWALVAICALADKRLTLRAIVIASAILSVLVYVIFKLLLGINLPLFPWGM